MHMHPSQQTLYIRGEVSVKTLSAAMYRQFETLCRQPELQAIDFQEVTRADSACISLLLCAQRLRSGSLKLIGLPQSVQDLAQLYDIHDWMSV